MATFGYFTRNNNQKHAGMMEGGWDRPRYHARMLGEHDGNDGPLAEGNDDNDNKYDKDGNIPNNDNKYAVGLAVLTSPLTRAMTSMILSATHA
jgi:hypothetical protein